MQENIIAVLYFIKKQLYSMPVSKTESMGADGSINQKFLDAKKLIFFKNKFHKTGQTIVGTEILAKSGKIIWAMNYFGKINSSLFVSDVVYIFLKEAITNLLANKPFRGPDDFSKNSFRYVSQTTGDANKFHGTEKIFCGKTLAYEGYFHGGII